MNTNRQNSTSAARIIEDKRRGRQDGDKCESDSCDDENSEDLDEVDSERRFQMI